MGILSRFKEIMSSNWNAGLDRAEGPEQMDRLMRSLTGDLGSVKAEMAAVTAAESRARRALDDCQAEVQKLQRYAEKAVEAGNDQEARKFLDRKAPLAVKEAQLQAAYDQAAANRTAMQQMHDKLAADVGQLEARYADLKARWTSAHAQQRTNEAQGAADAILDKWEDNIHEAEALAELKADKSKDLDAQFAELERLEKSASRTSDDELAAIKESLKAKE
ncbi:PspA/IM30 family protein [Paenibacillus athensensis]|uniref:Phage shock protein A (PspA) family protein n=1 Tax=Paenibacillus athensensis TaxID=1967502 RepID=A0A4Y8PZL9_9BACL|nr:PspA/IM30 family protein [Paenibacillus athensensis]MCD1258566.1 PspA/IM30 family protein [Paenibacillus athensensis]